MNYDFVSCTDKPKLLTFAAKRKKLSGCLFLFSISTSPTNALNKIHFVMITKTLDIAAVCVVLREL